MELLTCAPTCSRTSGTMQGVTIYAPTSSRTISLGYLNLQPNATATVAMSGSALTGSAALPAGPQDGGSDELL